MKESYQKIIALLLVVLVGAAIAFGLLVIDRLERITQVAERTEAKLDKIVEVATPVGRAAIEKGAATIEEIDTEELVNSAEAGLKEIGAAAKKSLLKHLEEQELKRQKKAQDGVGE